MNNPDSTQDLPSKIQEDYLRRHKRHHFLVHFLRILAIVLFLFLWEWSADAGYIDPFFFSSPTRILACFVQLWMTEALWRHIAITMTETAVSFLLVFLCSLLVATLLWYSSFWSEITEPYLVILNALPKSALAPLFIVWLGTGMKTIVTAGISVAIFGATISLYSGFKQTEPEKIKLIETLGGGPGDAFLKVVLPSNIPMILSTMKVNIGLALVGVVIGEFLAAREGLGYLIIYGSQVFKMSMVITSIVILCLIAMLFYAFIQFLEHQSKKAGR